MTNEPKTIPLEVEIPEGYEAVGYTALKLNDYTLTTCGSVVRNGSRGPRAGLKLRKLRWRAKRGEKYFYVTEDGDVFTDIDRRSDADNRRYNWGNHYQTMEEGKAARDKIADIHARRDEG